MARVAAIDVGSNAIRLAIGEISASGGLKIIHTDRKAVSLGRSVFADRERCIEKDIFDRAIEALKDFQSQLKKFDVERYRAVGTSALRDAANAEALIQHAGKVGITLEVISGDEEAKLIRYAVMHAIDLKDKNSALLDIGGGSAECTLLKQGKAVFSVSERVGTIRLLKSLSENKISTERFSERIRRVVQGLAQEVSRSVRTMKIDLFIGTGGNIEELGVLRTKLIKGKKKTNKVRIDELREIINILEPMSIEERQKEFGFRPDRADVILPAAVLLREVMEQLGVSKVLVPGVGLKDGILIELLGVNRSKQG